LFEAKKIKIYPEVEIQSRKNTFIYSGRRKELMSGYHCRKVMLYSGCMRCIVISDWLPPTRVSCKKGTHFWW